VKIAIIEVSLPGHWPFVNAIAKTFLSHPGNEVLVIADVQVATVQVATILEPLLQDWPINVEVVGDDLSDISRLLEDFGPDRVYIGTFELEPAAFLPLINEKTFLVVHNLSVCFPEFYGSNLRYYLHHVLKSLRHTSTYELFRRPKMHFSSALAHIKQIRKVVKEVSNAGGSYLVLSEHLEANLKRLAPSGKVTSFPFSIYEGALGKTAQPTLHICIPGSVTSKRRDYNSLLDALLTEEGLKLKDRITISFLGLIDQHTDGEELLGRIQKMESEGWNFKYWIDFVTPQEGDAQMLEADLILGNMVNNKGFVYGETKESGTPFNMIRSARPGILPKGHKLIQELESSTILFGDYQELVSIFHKLDQDRSYLQEMQLKALENARRFTPEALYDRVK
jgi:hypothetical protein